jgi:hypothetical protein
VKPAALRAIVGRMTDAPWTENKPARDADGWPLGAIVAATARGQAAYAKAERGTFPAADLTGIVALRNVADPLLELWQVCERETEAVCIGQSSATDDIQTGADRGECVGENHIETCPCELLQRKRLAVLTRLRGMP